MKKTTPWIYGSTLLLAFTSQLQWCSARQEYGQFLPRFLFALLLIHAVLLLLHKVFLKEGDDPKNISEVLFFASLLSLFFLLPPPLQWLRLPLIIAHLALSSVLFFFSPTFQHMARISAKFSALLLRTTARFFAPEFTIESTYHGSINTLTLTLRISNIATLTHPQRRRILQHLLHRLPTTPLQELHLDIHRRDKTQAPEFEQLMACFSSCAEALGVKKVVSSMQVGEEAREYKDKKEENYLKSISLPPHRST